jgi:hypothetical protein
MDPITLALMGLNMYKGAQQGQKQSALDAVDAKWAGLTKMNQTQAPEQAQWIRNLTDTTSALAGDEMRNPGNSRKRGNALMSVFGLGGSEQDVDMLPKDGAYSKLAQTPMSGF